MTRPLKNSDETDASLYNWLGARVRRFVRWWRRFDARVNQPMPAGRGRFWTWLAPDGYPWYVPTLGLVLITAMALGPTLRTEVANVAMLVFGLGLLALLHILAKRSRLLHAYLLAGQLFILVLLAAIHVVLAPPEAFGTDTQALRLHVGVAVAAMLAVSLGAVWTIARALFRTGTNGTLAHALPNVELFAPKDRYDFMGRGPLAALASAFFIAPISHPVELLLPGSLLVLFVPDHYLWPGFIIVGATAWLALFLGILFDRLMEVLKTVGRLFFVGPQFVISVLVIVVAVLRLAEVHYITYLFNAGSSGYGNTTIMKYVALAYAVAWYYAFWSDHFLARRLIRLLAGTGSEFTPLSIAYPYKGGSDLSKVKDAGRSIALHGAGRLKIAGEYEDSYEASGPALQFLTAAEVLTAFRTQLERMSAERTDTSHPLASVRNLQRSALVYPAITGACAFALIGIPWVVSLFGAVQPPEMAVNRAPPADLELLSLLQTETGPAGACPALGPDTPRIAVVASGGGTRAAIYTASLLHGLAKQGRICEVVAASGVSGGSAALAYFALHEDELRRPGRPDEAAWQRFSDTMALPFIEYVLDGASDMRIVFGRWRWRNAACGEAFSRNEPVVGWMPARSRLGSILAESFVCRMGAGVMADPSFGLILNTAMLGSFDAASGRCANGGLPLPEQARKCRAEGNAAGAGGRVVLTNLRKPEASPSAGEGMEIVTLNDASLSIARAAALSANFPPVFPDAAIDVQPAPGSAARRYWVTDGGAVENRGAITLYFSVRETMRRSPAAARLAPLHVVVADVSASDDHYVESFGFNSVLGAGGQLGLALEGELLADLKDIYCGRNSTITVHEIAMPAVLRNGGIGTHWLLPGSLTFTDPKTGDRVTLSADDVKKLVIALHDNTAPVFDDPKDAAKVVGWAREDVPSHQQRWQALLWALSMPAAQADSSCERPASGGAIYAP
ncbi:hypothetical protein QN222_18570 [Sinorhizobium sp. 6-70]|uniref:hypothetical protein n=2 Tax=unclassified Sinorhizobium TaxID=2613772 RepID=UPI0024C32C89|nr:hypothetical protein [Sinorhizobium sp. 6-70]MDK1376489.1 hypothetical protein [Sinorhizobium sp. 6-70]